MIVGDYVDVYKPNYNGNNEYVVKETIQSIVVLKISTGPAGWIVGLWSFLPRSKEYQLDISVCTSGLSSIGSTVLKVDSQILTYFDQLRESCENTVYSSSLEECNFIWHPSGQNIAIVEHGIVIIASLQWMDKKKNVKVSMMTANEIYSNMDEDMVINECISVDLEILHQLNIGASSISAIHTENNLMIGTKSGFIQIINWEGKVISSNSNSNLSEERELFRIWKHSLYPLRKNINTSYDMKANNVDLLSKTSMIKSLHFDEKTHTLVSLFADGSFSISVFHYTTLTSSASATASKSNDNISISNCDIKDSRNYLLSTTKIHPILLVGYPISTFTQSVIEEKQQPLPCIYELSTAYTDANISTSTDSVFDGNYSNNFDMVHRSKDYITSYDVDSLLDLSPTLLAKICRIKSLVNGSCLEEMGTVLEFRLLGNDDERESLHTHAPTTTVLSSVNTKVLSIVRKVKLLMLVGTKHVPDSSNNFNFISDQRLYSLSLVLLDINISTSTPHHASTKSTSGESTTENSSQAVSPSAVDDGTVQCRCTQSICLNKNEKFTTGSWDEVSHHLELVRTSRNSISGSYVLALVSGLVTCRSVQALHSVVFTINTRIHYSSLSVECCCNLVDISVTLGKIIISVWSHNKNEVLEACHSSKVFMISMITSASSTGAGSKQNQGYFIDYNDGSLISHSTNHHLNNLSSNRKNCLKIPHSLMSNIMFYQQLCAVNNPFIHTIGTTKSTYNFVQNGLLIASSKQSQYTIIEKENMEESKYSPFIKCKSFTISNDYLALVAGGDIVPYKAIRKIFNKNTNFTKRRSVPYQLWIYNPATHRWRSTYLNIGNEFSKATLLQDLTAITLYHPHSNCSSSSSTIDASTVPLAVLSFDDSNNNMIVENDFDPLLGDFKSNLPCTPKANKQTSDMSYNDFTKGNKAAQLKNSNIPITSKSHLSGEISAVVALAWFGDHTILLLTLRKTNYCLEILTREVTRPSLSIGKPYPFIHKIIEMPPGYCPNILEIRIVNIKETMKTSNEGLKTNSYFHSFDSNMSDFITSHLRNSESKQIQMPDMKSHYHNASFNCLSENCLVIVSDGHHFICYQISKQYKDNYEDRISLTTCSISDYLVVELWDLNLSELRYQQQQILNHNEIISSIPSSDHVEIALPIQEIHLYIQNALILGKGYQESDNNDQEISVSMMLLDAHGKVICIDPLKKSYSMINQGPIYRILQFNNEDLLQPMKANELVCEDYTIACCTSDANNIATTSNTNIQINKINNCFLFYMVENKLYDLQTSLINIFRNATLLKRFGRISENTKLETSKLWLPFETTIESSEENKVLEVQPPYIRTLSIEFHNLQGIQNIETIDDEIYHHNYSSLKCLDLMNINTPLTINTTSSGSSSQIHSQGRYNSYKISLKCFLFKVIFSNLVKRTTVNNRNSMNVTAKDDHHSSILVTNEIAIADAIGFLEQSSMKSNKLDSRLEIMILENILYNILNSLHSTSRTATNFISQLELDTKHMIESIAHNNDLHSHFTLLTSYLSSNSSLMLCELISRLGRKLEPSISKHLYPFCIGHMGDNASSVGVITMFESCLAANPPQFHHAARTLSLACESMGGTEQHITTTASLVLALELLYHSIHQFSLNNTIECLEFCLRLESIIIEHSRSKTIIKETSIIEQNLVDISYIRTIKTQALALIRKERKRSNQPLVVTSTNAESNYCVKRLDNSSQSLLPYFIEIGINWFFGQLNNDKLEQSESHKEDFQNTLMNNNNNNNNNNSEPHIIHTNIKSYSKVNAVQRMKEMLLVSSIEEDSPINEFHYNTINALDKEYNDDLKLPNNCFTQSPSNLTSLYNIDHLHSYNSPTLLLVILILKEFMHNETQYINVAVFMSALLGGSSTFIDLVISHFSILLLNKNINSMSVNYSCGTTLDEKLRRIMYCFGLNKVIFSNNNELIQQLLQQRLSPQYIRRVIEANGKRNSSRYNSGSFELIDDMLNNEPSLNKSTDNSSEQIKYINQDSLTLLTLLKSLLIGLLLVEDYSIVMHLLKVIHKGINPEIHSILYISINNVIIEEMSSESLIRLIKVIVQNI